ncbi:hypothetical protein JTB14_024706 [Gonioctena quinquepunctata]|nr:hypothetical protein JTB14_024706 [Gonioctena quinquepunctata]
MYSIRLVLGSYGAEHAHLHECCMESENEVEQFNESEYGADESDHGKKKLYISNTKQGISDIEMDGTTLSNFSEERNYSLEKTLISDEKC